MNAIRAVASLSLPSREDIRAAIYRDGIIGCLGAFTREWVEQLAQDIARGLQGSA